MAELYDFHIRKQNPSWGIPHAQNLLDLAENHQDSSFVIYSILECRNMLERIEFEILVLAAHSSPESEWQEIILGKNGIRKVNEKYKALKYRYQTFTEAFSKTVFDNYPLKSFDFKQAEDKQTKLSQYLHIYSRTNEELSYSSSFIIEGIELVNETIEFITKTFSPEVNGHVFGTLNFSSLSDSMKKEFNNWLNGISTDVDDLTNRLEYLVKTENNGEKMKVKLNNAH